MTIKPRIIPTPSQQLRTALVEDVEFMLTHGESAAGAARRLGLHPASIARTLYRAGRKDLAHHFGKTTK